MALRTDAVLPVPVQLVAGRAGTLVASQRVDAAVLAASAVDAALIDVCGRQCEHREITKGRGDHQTKKPKQALE